jgi:hypothetical protein
MKNNLATLWFVQAKENEINERKGKNASGKINSAHFFFELLGFIYYGNVFRLMDMNTRRRVLFSMQFGV